MQRVLVYESLKFHPRDGLERLQMFSRTLRNMVVAGSSLLPLRTIDRVDLDCQGQPNKIRIFAEEDDDALEQAPDFEASLQEGDFAEVFRRLQHVCIRDVRVGIRDSPFLRYWKAQQAADFTVVCIEFDPPETTDYVLLDSIVNRLRPRTTYGHFMWTEDGYRGEELEFLARASFLNSLQIVRSMVWDDAFPPSSFFLQEPGYPNYELWCDDGSSVPDGIDDLIESFIRDGCSNEKLETVCMSWDESSLVSKRLRKPTKVDRPLPKSEMPYWLTPARVSECEMYSFVNANHWKRMEVYKWTVEEDRCTTHVLECLVKDLSA
ncbi:hypothetical protein AAVH_12807 [Aphelenchoides avenae]|nr:hypothetical protein AAVH_12807 [Aphelenchus avenae]